MKNRVLSVTIMSLLSSVALADTYQAEAGLVYDNTDADFLASDYDTYTIGGSVYFKPVDDSKGPRAEAAFLDRASDVTATYSDSDDDFADESYTASTRVVLGNGTILEAGYADFDVEEVYRVGLGTYLSDHSDVMLSYSKADESDVSKLEAAYHSVVKLAGTSSLGYTVSGGYVDSPVDDKGYTFGGDVTYYFNPNLGLGALASFTDQDDVDTSTYGLQASYFITPAFYVNGYAKTTDYDGPNEDSYGIGASVRF